MAPEEMLAFAQAIVEGAPIRRAEMVAFMRTFVEPPVVAVRGDGPAPSPPAPAGAYLPPDLIQLTGTGKLYVSREANRQYSAAEAVALAAQLADVMGRMS